jgi:uncharacterized protein (DUF2141 family)
MLTTEMVAQDVNFTIQVTGFQQNSGQIRIAVYNKENGFLVPERVYKKIVLEVNQSILKHTLQLPQGNYAIALYHDNNSNGICDKNFLGIPTERYGFSNNIRPILSAPSFKSTVVEVKKDLEIKIALLN